MSVITNYRIKKYPSNWIVTLYYSNWEIGHKQIYIDWLEVEDETDAFNFASMDIEEIEMEDKFEDEDVKRRLIDDLEFLYMSEANKIKDYRDIV